MHATLILPGLWLALGTLVMVPPSPRTTEILRLDCSSDVGRREITLFGNGTVRLKEGIRGEDVMYLDELGPDELNAYLRRLRGEDLSETEPRYDSVEGDWVEECILRLHLPGRELQEFEFGRYDSLSLELNRVVSISLEIAEHVDLRMVASGLPRDYEPKIGDYLRRLDGEVFEVVGFTGDELGVELEGVEQPLTVYIAIDQLRARFVAVVSRLRD